ncbi:MAG: hypothetical protein SF182_07765 [Deltaproteobacteria bacterium]|nr:hypothetical protein [Deltaproteobacteria bacterium]
MSPRALAALLAVALCAGCAAKGSYPTRLNTRAQLGDAGTADDAEIERLFAASPQLPAAPRAALLLIGSRYAGSVDAEDALADRLRRRLQRSPFLSVQILPESLAVSFTPSHGLSLSHMRSAAARLQDEVLVVISTDVDVDTGTNLLSATYFALVPMAFVPGSEVGAWASAEACAIDVRSGLFLGCASGHGQARDGFVIPLNSETARRDVAREALGRAAAGLPDQIADLVAARIASGAGQAPLAAHGPAGPRYDTVAAD